MQDIGQPRDALHHLESREPATLAGAQLRRRLRLPVPSLRRTQPAAAIAFAGASL